MKSEVLITRIEDGSRKAVWVDHEQGLVTALRPVLDHVTWLIETYEPGPCPTIVVSDTGRRRNR